MSRFFKPRVLLLAITLAAPCAMAGETWELGGDGWGKVAEPDPTTPAGQLQLMHRELVAAQTQEGLPTDPTTVKLNAFFAKNPRHLLDADGKPLHGAALSARRKFWKAMLFPHDPAPVESVDDAAQAVQEKVELWLKANPRHELEAEARLLHGDALSARRRFWKALYDYEFVARHFTATPSFTTALERERRLAEIFLNGWKRKFLGMSIIPTREEAVEILVRIQERVPGSAMGEEASLRLGDWYFETADMDMAVEAYSVFLQNYPDSRSDAYVLRRIIEASLARFSGPKFDSTGLIEARQRIAEYTKKYPLEAQKLGATALLLRIGESLALRDFFNANWYERRGEAVSAAVLYRRLIALHPGTQAAHDATARLVELRLPLVDARDPALLAKPAPAPAEGKP